eukprot:CAMPEP_0195259874 /NCGR_PEP_ID=MMETSP0706-20130129/8232_1 /TAXON_ID=33640 /ORGANISM="Asterionellopsis glacialis, Strain CCMP134" /LENGTH=121 /DNA_ID=CAMNT_0040313473 /DNA_START=52 /DNA_END=417 /DNA_ORIENTATION=-
MNIRSLVAFLIIAVVGAQEYAEYGEDYSQQDNLYHDYAMRQQEKETGKAGGMGLGKLIMGTGVGWLAGAKIHSDRLRKKLNKKHQQEQKQLYTQYYNDVYALQEQNGQLVQALEQMGVRMK